MSAAAGILRTQLRSNRDCETNLLWIVIPCGSGATPRWDGAEFRPHTRKLKTMGSWPGPSITNISKLRHSADRLDRRIISQSRCHNPPPRVGNTGRIRVPERCGKASPCKTVEDSHDERTASDGSHKP